MQTTRVELSKLIVNPKNPRRDFSEDGIRSLARSIQRYGLLSPLIVRRVGANRFALIAGERRLRALQLLKREYADCVVFAAYDLDCRLIALVENLQREDLHYLDEARAYRDILDDRMLTQDALARSIGRSPSAIANRLRLLKLPSRVLDALQASPGLTERHARALLRLSREEDMLEAVTRAAREKMSVRTLEGLVEKLLEQKRAVPRVKKCIRDERVFLNAVLNAVRDLNTLGVPAVSRVEHLPDRVEITVILPSLSTAAEPPHACES